MMLRSAVVAPPLAIVWSRRCLPARRDVITTSDLAVNRRAILTPRIASSANVTLMAPLQCSIRCRLIGRARWLSRLARREGLWAGRALHSPSRPQPRAMGQRSWRRRAAPRATSCSAAFRLSALSRRCTIECCLVPNSSGYFSLSRPTIASAVSCGCSASQPSIAAICGSSLDGMRTLVL